MLNFLSGTSSAGFVISGDSLKYVKIILKNNIPFVSEAHTYSLGEIQDNVKQLDIESGQTVLTTCLAASDVLVRSLEIKLAKKKDVESVLAFQAEPLFPFPLNEAILDHIPLAQGKERTLLTVLGVRKEVLKSHLNKMQSLGIDPEAVSTAPVALANFSHALGSSSEHSALIIHFDMEETLCILAEKGKLIAHHAIKKGVLNLTQAVKEPQNFSDIDFSAIDEKQTPELAAAATHLKHDVSRAIFSLIKQHKGQKLSQVLLTGQGAAIKGVEALFSEGLHTTLSKPQAQFGQTSELLQEYAIPIGLALGSLSGAEPEINFRRKEFAYGDPWKRLKMPLYGFFAASVLLAFSILFLGNAWRGKKLDTLKQNYSVLLETLEKPYTPFEKRYLSSYPFDEGKDIKNLSLEQLANRIHFLETEVSRTPNTFKLFPDVPRVTDTLAWLANHNLVTDTENGNPLLNIKNLHYSLVKRPDGKNKNQKYQVKVELEFSTDVPKVARKFHDALIAPNDLLDPKTEVKWSSSGDIYRTSFFLRNKPPKKMAKGGIYE